MMVEEGGTEHVACGGGGGPDWGTDLGAVASGTTRQ
jgi:hypothetical protein